jgi:DNA-binding transcriptional MerR regulator
MSYFSIQDLSDFSGIKPHTIRIWEQRFTFLSPKRNENFRRLYSNEELNTFLDVILLIQSGHKISKVAKMTTEEKIETVAQLNQDQYALRATNELIVCMAEMDVERFELVLASGTMFLGIHEMIRQVIIPFSEKVGLFQNFDGKNYIENLVLIKDSVRQKLFYGIEKITFPAKTNKLILFFLPPTEQQEFPLMYMNYLLKLEGINCIYLGRDIEIATLERVCTQKCPDFLVTLMLSKKGSRDLNNFIDTLPKVQPTTTLVSIGNALHNKNIPQHKCFITVSEALIYIHQQTS